MGSKKRTFGNKNKKNVPVRVEQKGESPLALHPGTSQMTQGTQTNQTWPCPRPAKSIAANQNIMLSKENIQNSRFFTFFEQNNPKGWWRAESRTYLEARATMPW